MASLSARRLAFAACLIFIYGAKCWLIAGYGSETPFWDQWSGEAAGVFRPYLGGTLTFESLFAYHNEHRLVFVRLWTLALLIANGTWIPILEMLANACIHVAAIGALIVMVC